MRVEKRARVEVFVPLSTGRFGLPAVSQWIAEEFAFVRGGSTSTFIGLFASHTTGHIIRDQAQIVFTDVLLDLDDGQVRDELVAELDLLPSRLLKNELSPLRHEGTKEHKGAQSPQHYYIHRLGAASCLCVLVARPFFSNLLG